MKYFLVVLVVFCVFGQEALCMDLTEKDKGIISDAVREKLTDPDSAKFKWLPLITNELAGSYCGLVNSKNRFGGFVGYVPYFAFFTKRPTGEIFNAIAIRVASGNEESIASQVTIEACAKSGYTNFETAR